MYRTRFSKSFRSFLLASLSISAFLCIPAAVSQAQPETPEQILEALAEQPQTLTGTYLSARNAEDNQDLAMAAHFYAQALSKDPDNALLLERNFSLTLSVGAHDEAFKLAERISERQALATAAEQEMAKSADGAAQEIQRQLTEADHRIAPMVSMALGVKALKGKKYASALKNFEAGLYELNNHPVDLAGMAALHRQLSNPRLLSVSAQYGPFAMISQTVLQAWALIGQDRENLPLALELLNGIENGDINQFFFALHSGLIAAYAKDYPKAIQFLQDSLSADPNSPSTAEALINVLLRAGDEDGAREVLDTFLDSLADEEDKEWLQVNYGPMKPVASPIRTPQDGAAELFSTLGDALAQEQAIEGAALYLQFADYLRADHDRTEYALARLFERMKRDEHALAHYDQIAPQSPIYRRAKRQASFALTRLKRADEAISLLTAMMGDKDDDLETISVLSRIYQSEKRYQASIDLLTRGLDSLPIKDDIHWSLYFLRGSAYDQIKDWPNTERDMQAALDLFPNQPTVLNYLGYSWVDRGLHLDKAIEMIRQAVALRPYDGFFVDSLGWAHYRLENYEEAVKHLERAVELRPEDPTITDHLGDAYWMVGRRNEAYFQWKRVKTLQPTDELLSSVKHKVENGLEK